jgi:hypothetical protein
MACAEPSENDRVNAEVFRKGRRALGRGQYSHARRRVSADGTGLRDVLHPDVGPVMSTPDFLQ